MKKYEYVVKELSEIINASNPGDKLPTERELARRFSISPMTVRRAFQFLQAGKRIYSVPGSGTYVAERRVSKTLLVQSFTESMRSQGRIPSSRLILAAMRCATAEDVDALNLPEDAFVYDIERVRLADGIPMGIEKTILNAGLLPDLLKFDISESLYDILHTHFGRRPESKGLTARTRLPSAHECKLLEISKNTPCFDVTYRGKDSAGVLVEYTRGIYRGDLYELSTYPI